MKLYFAFTSGVVFISTVFHSSATDQFIINFTAPITNVGPTLADQYGALNSSAGGHDDAPKDNHIETPEPPPPPSHTSSDASPEFVYLKPHSEISFTYTFPGLFANSAGTDGLYNYQPDARGPNTPPGPPNGGGPSSPITFAAAGIGSNTATITVTNNSDGGVNIDDTTHTPHVSAVPLPATLPMFSALLAGMFGVARLGRQRKIASFAA